MPGGAPLRHCTLRQYQFCEFLLAWTRNRQKLPGLEVIAQIMYLVVQQLIGLVSLSSLTSLEVWLPRQLKFDSLEGTVQNFGGSTLRLPLTGVTVAAGTLQN